MVKEFERRKKHCAGCGGPILRPGFKYCPWCGETLITAHFPVSVEVPLDEVHRDDIVGVYQCREPQREICAEMEEAKRDTGGHPPYNPEDRKCPNCDAPVIIPSFRFCAWCGCNLLESVAPEFDSSQWTRPFNYFEEESDRAMSNVLLKDENNRYRELPEELSRRRKR